MKRFVFTFFAFLISVSSIMGQNVNQGEVLNINQSAGPYEALWGAMQRFDESTFAKIWESSGLNLHVSSFTIAGLIRLGLKEELEKLVQMFNHTVTYIPFIEGSDSVNAANFLPFSAATKLQQRGDVIDPKGNFIQKARVGRNSLIDFLPPSDFWRIRNNLLGISKHILGDFHPDIKLLPDKNLEKSLKKLK